MIAYAQRRDLFVRDCWAGADPAHRIGVRVVNETAWHNLFARNMFLRPKPEELEGFKPEFTILNLPGFQADPKLDGTASDCAILVNFTERVVAICGTWYAGEIKKSVFTMMNYLLPDKERAADALLRQYRAEGRRRRLLRPVGTGQDHAVGRPERAR
jgi:phosphoenolpyruvate carboxykinase (ATP)